MSTDPQFTDAEIEFGVVALISCFDNHEILTGTLRDSIEATVRAVLRAVGAVPARMLVGAEPGEPFAVGTWIRGQGSGIHPWEGEVLDSRPLTTQIRTAEGQERLVWTRTAHSHERPSATQFISFDTTHGP